MSLRALIISKSAVSRANLRNALGTAGLGTVVASTDDEIERGLADATFALIAVALPEPERLAMLKQLRTDNTSARPPILVILESSEAGPRIRALHAGARDCVSEPYDPAFLGDTATALASSGQPRRARNSSAPARILVVDDSATYSSALAEELRHDGHDIVTASDATEALELLALECVDEVVVDVFMPDIGGVELTSRIRARAATSDVPILMLTGRKDSTVKGAGLAAGADDFVVKSGDLGLIRTHVATLLRHAAHHHHGKDVAPRPHRHASSPSLPAPDSQRHFLDRVVAASGLSALTGRSCVQRACKRAGVEPADLDARSLGKVLPHLEPTLRIFAPPGELEGRLQAIAALAQATPEEGG